MLLNSSKELSRSDYVFAPQVGLGEYVRKAYGEHARARGVGHSCTKDSLYIAVQNVCDTAMIPRWSSVQLRKTRATQARRESGLEVAQGILGHSSKSTSEPDQSELGRKLKTHCHGNFDGRQQ